MPEPLPPPPPPPAARGDSKLARPDSRAEQSYAAADPPVTVTGSRIARQGVAAAEPEAESDEGTIVLSGTRTAGPGRGDWNACTVDDPKRSLAGCRHLVDPGARGAAGRSAARIAEGLSSAWQGDYQQSIASFDRALAIAPRSAFIYLNRGLARKRDGDLDGALADLDRAVRYAPRTARLYYQRARILRQRGDEKRARADERRAVNLDPDYQALLP
jgi:tetratricopeptide (TPR) repeat protein